MLKYKFWKFLPCRGKHVGLIQDVVPPSLGGNLEYVVEALGALADEDVPASVIVSLPLQSLDFHPIDQTVCPQNVELFLRVVLGVFVGPVGLARAGQTNHD